MHTGRLWAALAISAALAGCASDHSRRISAPPPPFDAGAPTHATGGARPAEDFLARAPRRLNLEDAPPPEHCSLRDRFDRKEVIAYNFADGQSRLGLKLGIDGFSLSDPGAFELREVRVNFRYRFQPIKKKRERCLYASPWQGLAGSGYNELVLRDRHTVYEELDDEIDRARDRLDKLFGE